MYSANTDMAELGIRTELDPHRSSDLTLIWHIIAKKRYLTQTKNKRSPLRFRRLDARSGTLLFLGGGEEKPSPRALTPASGRVILS